MANHTKPRQRPRPARSIGWALEPFGTSPGVLRITVGKEPTDYLLEPLSSDFGRAFRLTKPDGERYHVLLADDGRHSCECKGFLRWNHCKHVEGLAALVEPGRLM
jgi:hypothetical protein